MTTLRAFRSAFALLFAILALIAGTEAAQLTSPSQLSATNTVIDFESLPLGPASNPLEVDGTSFSTAASLFIYRPSDDGYAPPADLVSGRLLRANATSELFSMPYADLRIDFATPVGQIGVSWWDCTYTTNVLEAYNSAGVLLETATFPSSGSGGSNAAFAGIRRAGNDIAYVIAKVTAENEVGGFDNISFGPVTHLGSGKVVYQQFTNDYVNDFDGLGVELVLMDADGTNREVIAQSEFFRYGYAALNADGTRVAFVAEQGIGGPKLWVMNAAPLDGINIPIMMRENVSAFSRIAWSPDGKRIAFQDGTDPQIYVLNAVDGTGTVTPESPANLAVKVTSVNSQSQNPAWSPDGKYLAYSNGATIYATSVVDSNGGLTPEAIPSNPPQLLTAPTAPATPIHSDLPAWSPDGTKIVFHDSVPGPGLDRTDIAILTARQPNFGPLITPSIGATTDARVSIFRNPADGFNARFVFPERDQDENIITPSSVSDPSWSVDGSRIIYGFQIAGPPDLTTIYSLKPEREDFTTNPSVAITTITSLNTGVPGGRRPLFQAVASVSLPALPKPAEFDVASGEPGEPWIFTAEMAGNQPGVFLRVQSTLTPGAEGSWVDLPGGGQMTRNGDTWTLESSLIPFGTRYFRVIAAATGHLDSKLPYPNAESPSSFLVTSATGRILFTRGSVLDRELVIMESDGSDKVVLTDVTLNPQQCALSPDGTLAAFTTLDGSLFVMKAEPMNGTTNVPVDVLEGAPVTAAFGSSFAWSPNGMHLAFAGSDSHLHVIEAVDAGGDIVPFDENVNPLIDVGETLSGSPNPAWSPDGKYLAIMGANAITAFQITDGTGAITPIGAGNQPFSLTDSGSFTSKIAFGAWSPDGQSIAFVEELTDGSQARIAVLQVRDGDGEILPEAAGNLREELYPYTAAPFAETVSWSPDGSLLAIGAVSGGQFHIEVFRPEAVDTSNPRIPITLAADGDAFQPSFEQAVTTVSMTQLVAFEASNYAGNEDGSPIELKVIRSGGSSGELTVDFSVTGGTATEGADLEDTGADFVISEGPLVFADGETEKLIVITPILDTADAEGDESLIVELDEPDTGELGSPSSATVIIHDSDSSNQPFVEPADELAIALNGKAKKAGKAKSGDVWSFKVRQTQDNTLAGLEVKIQVTATPDVPGSWINLPEGALTRANSTSFTWVGSTTLVPAGKVYFRSRTHAIGRRSNAGPVVGPFTVVPAPVLEMSVAVATDSDPQGLSVRPGEFITYTLTCKNAGAAPAKKVVLNSLIPRRTRFDGASNANAGGTFVQDLDRKGVMTDGFWNVGDLAAGASVTEFVRVQVDQTVPFDWIILNNRLTYRRAGQKETFLPSFRTDVAAPIRITVAKDKNIVQAGDLITYTLTLHNDASFAVTGGKVTDQVPSGTRLVSYFNGDGNGNYLGTELSPDSLIEAPNGMVAPGFTPHNGMLTWNVGTIEANGTRQLRFTVRVAYDLFEKIARNGESFNVEIQNLNFDFLATPPSGGVIAARGGVIPGSQIARTFVSEETPATQPQLGLKKAALTDSRITIGSEEFTAVRDSGSRLVEYEVSVWNYGNVAAQDGLLRDGIPADTELTMEKPCVGDADDDTFTTVIPHGFSVNEKVILSVQTPSKKGVQFEEGIYFVRSAPTLHTFTLSAAAGGQPIDLLQDIREGAVRRATYDFQSFMENFSFNGVPFTDPTGFKFYDADGNELSAGGEPFIDKDGDGRIEKGDFIDQNSNGRYDGPGAIRMFTYSLGDVAPMANPAATLLNYTVKLKSSVRRKTFIAALSATTHERGHGLALTTPDYFYPLDGSPTTIFTKVVAPVEFVGDEPAVPGQKFIFSDPITHQKVCRFNFTNVGDLPASGVQLRIPLPAGFTTNSAPVERVNRTLDTVFPGSPGTAVFDIGTVEPGEMVERDLNLILVSPTAPSLFDRKGFLKEFDVQLHPRVVAGGYTAPVSSGFRRLLNEPGTSIKDIVLSGLPSVVFPAQKEPNKDSTCVFVGRIAPASVNPGNFEIFIFCGNLGGARSDAGEVAMQIPFGTRFVSADAVAYNGVEGDAGRSETFNFSPGYITQEGVRGRRERPNDGLVDVIRWKFANIAPSQILAFKVTLFANDDIPGNKIHDRSCYVKCENAHGKVASPLSIHVRRYHNGTADFWQSIGNFVDEAGLALEDAVRALLGQHRNDVTLNSQIVSLGGADFVQLTTGQIMIPLGNQRSAVIGRADALNGRTPAQSFVFRTGGSDQLALVGAKTSLQQVFVPGGTNAFRDVQSILAGLVDPVNSIVAGGGGNIVAGGGGNVVANDGAGIVAGGGLNFKPGAVAKVVANDGAGLLPGTITFTPLNGPGIVAGGGGNIVAGGGGNIVAAGGGNIVAGGGGNLVLAGAGDQAFIDGKQITADKLPDVVNKLIGQDAAGILSKKSFAELIGDGAGTFNANVTPLIGQDGAGLIGQDGAGLIGDGAGTFLP